MPDPKSTAGGDPQILVVEDAPDNWVLVEQIFADSGYAVACVPDGAAAMAWLERNLPALILLDLSLPGLDGWEVAKRLKADPRTASVPIVALTAHAMLGDRETALAAGCNDYLTKPIDIDQLELRVKYWIDRAAIGSNPAIN